MYLIRMNTKKLVRKSYFPLVSENFRICQAIPAFSITSVPSANLTESIDWRPEFSTYQTSGSAFLDNNIKDSVPQISNKAIDATQPYRCKLCLKRPVFPFFIWCMTFSFFLIDIGIHIRSLFPLTINCLIHKFIVV